MESHKNELTLQQAIEIVRNAFVPLRCEVEGLSYGQGIRFRILGHDGQVVLNAARVMSAILSDPRELQVAMKNARGIVTSKGFTLTPWRLAVPPS